MDALGNVAQQFGVYWPNLIAQVVLFAIVYYVLKRFAFKPVIAMLEERRRRIEEGQLNAENIKKQLIRLVTREDLIHHAQDILPVGRVQTGDVPTRIPTLKFSLLVNPSIVGVA